MHRRIDATRARREKSESHVLENDHDLSHRKDTSDIVLPQEAKP